MNKVLREQYIAVFMSGKHTQVVYQYNANGMRVSKTVRIHLLTKRVKRSIIMIMTTNC